MAESLAAAVYLEPDKISMRIFSLPDLKVVENVATEPFSVISSKQAENYAANMDAITAGIKNCQRLLKSYDVKDVEYVASLADVDDANRRYIADQIYVRTGVKVTWMNNNQLVAYSLAAVQNKLPQFADLSKHSLYVLILGLDITTLAYYHHGKFIRTWEIDLGESKVATLLDELRQTAANPVDIIQDYINSKLEYIAPELISKKHTKLLLLKAGQLNKSLLKPGKHLAKVPEDQLKQVRTMLLDGQEGEIEKQYGIKEQNVSWLMPNSFIIAKSAQLIGPREIDTTDVGVLDGLLYTWLTKSGQAPSVIHQMVQTAADNLAERYGSKSKHSEFVTKVSLSFFDALRPIHHLGVHERRLLEVAAKIEDIGNFINPQAHYRHSEYILRATPLIGLSDDDNRIVAEVARYHSAESPQAGQFHYQQMNDDIKLTVAKLAAILRVVDSLDDSRLQKISKIKLKLKNHQLRIYAKADDDLVLERWSFSKKSKLFREVYGITPVLIERGAK